MKEEIAQNNLCFMHNSNSNDEYTIFSNLAPEIVSASVSQNLISSISYYAPKKQIDLKKKRVSSIDRVK